MKNIEQELKDHGVFVAKTEGDSMQPMLIAGQDSVVIVPPKFPLKKYDVPVYRRGGHYTMHRIVKVTKKGYVICGDNRAALERDIKDKDIIGVMTAFYHGGKLVDCKDKEYIAYSKRICRNLPLRRIKEKLNKFKKVLNQI